MGSDLSLAERLSKILEGIDLTSADGRAGMKTLLRELESPSPGLMVNEVAGGYPGRIPLRRAG